MAQLYHSALFKSRHRFPLKFNKIVLIKMQMRMLIGNECCKTCCRLAGNIFHARLVLIMRQLPATICSGVSRCPLSHYYHPVWLKPIQAVTHARYAEQNKWL